MSTPITIALIDDHPLIRKGIIQLLEMEESISLAGEADSGEEGVKLIRERQPDLVLLDLNMKKTDGITTLKRIKRRWPTILVVILTASDNPQNILDAFHHKADGYLLKNTDPEKIVQQLLDVMNGKTIISPEVEKILRTAPRNSNKIDNDAELTRREQEVLKLIGNGLSNQQIGDQLGISVWTAKVHAKHILNKLKLSSRNELIVWALRQGTDSD